jgi:hypothetical protein
MNVKYFDTEFEIPDILIDKYSKDFEGMAGKSLREEVLDLRDSTNSVLEYVEEEPEALEDQEVLYEFINAMAVRQALKNHGLLYDA